MIHIETGDVLLVATGSEYQLLRKFDSLFSNLSHCETAGSIAFIGAISELTKVEGPSIIETSSHHFYKSKNQININNPNTHSIKLT
jgi:hypothetical protein